jgi:hypothetical protein
MDNDSLSACQQDTSKLKEGLPDFLAYTVEGEDPKVSKDKSGHGFNHPHTAHALCPQAYIYGYDNDAK